MAGLMVLLGTAFGQVTPTCENYLESLPAHLSPLNSTPQTYVLTTDYVDYNLFGNFIRKKRITGECTLLMNGFVKWNNIKTAHSENQAEEFPEGEVQPVMENFTYNPASDILSDTFFSSIPQADVYMKRACKIFTPKMMIKKCEFSRSRYLSGREYLINLTL